MARSEDRRQEGSSCWWWIVTALRLCKVLPLKQRVVLEQITGAPAGSMST